MWAWVKFSGLFNDPSNLYMCCPEHAQICCRDWRKHGDYCLLVWIEMLCLLYRICVWSSNFLTFSNILRVIVNLICHPINWSNHKFKIYIYMDQELGFPHVYNLGTVTSQMLWMFANLIGKVHCECGLLQALAGCDVWICLFLSRKAFLCTKSGWRKN